MKTYLRCIFAVTTLLLIIVVGIGTMNAHDRIDEASHAALTSLKLSQKAHRRIAELEAEVASLRSRLAPCDVEVWETVDGLGVVRTK